MSHRMPAPPQLRHPRTLAMRSTARAPYALPHTSMRGGDPAAFGGTGHAGRKLVGGLVALSLTVLLLALCAVARPRSAWASTVTFPNGVTAEVNDETGEMTGQAHIEYLPISMTAPTTYFDVLLPDGQVIVGHCINPGAFIPLDGYYRFTGTPKDNGVYSVVVWGQDSEGYNPISSPYDYWPAQNVGDITWTPTYAGWLELRKTSADARLTANNAAYSLAGAIYGIYSDAACTVEVTRISTDSSGHASSKPLATGTYYVREISPSLGYALDSVVHAARIEAGGATTLDVSESPSYAVPPELLAKVDADTRTASAQGSASLAGAVYSISHYSGYHTLENLPATALRSFSFKTDDGGRIPFDRAHLVSGEPYTGADGTLLLPLGTYVIEEMTPSEGYRSSSPTRKLVQVRRDSTAVITHGYSAPSDAERIIRGGVSVRKRDAESHAIYPLGSGSFEGISFQIVNRSARAVIVDGASHAPGTVCATILTNADGIASTAADALPYGTYEIRESDHGRGYLGNESWSQSFCVTRQGEVVNLHAVGSTVEDQIRRGDISLSKHDGGTGELMAGVAFLLTSNTTGESHVIVTDENGMLSTASSWNRHTTSTNANDAALVTGENGNLSVDETLLDPEAGVWFGAARLDDDSTSSTTADDGLGALPYDRAIDGGGYTLRELPSSANLGHRMIETTFSITRDGVTLDLGSFDDEPVQLRTTLTAPGGGHVAAAGNNLSLTDVVSYDGLVAGRSYQIEGELHAFDDDGSDLGVVANSSVDFIAQATQGTISAEFELDATRLAGRRLVAFETLLDSGDICALHADPDDDEQTVYLPSLATVAHGLETLGDDAVAQDVAGVIDTVSYSGLQPSEGYELLASLHLLGEDGSDEGVVGQSSTSFDAASSSGSVTVSVESINLSAYVGRDLVMFEELMLNGDVWATHEELLSESQTVHIPAIHTSATSARDTGLLAATSDESIVDTVSYENLLPETAYQLHATLHLVTPDGNDFADGGVVAVAEPVSFVTPAATDGAHTVSGSIEVPLSADLTGLDGARLVVFEELMRGEVSVASHDNLADIAQTLYVPTIHTTATHDGDHDVLAAADRDITDEVRYENLVPGLTYSLEGSLMGIPTDGSSPIVLATSTLEFEPTEAAGNITVNFDDVDLSKLAGQRVVAYETLVCDDVIVTSHHDPNSSSQTISVPQILTEAHGASGTHTALAGSDQAITDTITYEGLLPEHTYTATATLHAVRVSAGGTRSDGGAVSDPSTVTFTTPAAEDGQSVVSGTVEVTLHAYLSDLAGSDVVCFEQISRDDTVVATHEDASSASQTVSIPSLSTQATAADPDKHGIVPVTDLISWKNLVVGETYEVIGTLHRKGASGEDLGAIELSEGEPLTVRESFVAQDVNGSMEVRFDVDVDALNLAGTSVVVFEELRQSDVVVARHSEIGSLEQLVAFDETGTPTPSPFPQTGRNEAPYVVLALLALAALGSGLVTSWKYDR